MLPDFYLNQTDVGVQAEAWLQTIDKGLLASRGLSGLTAVEIWNRVQCLPTSVLCAINLFAQKRIFACNGDKNCLSVSDFYTSGVLAHLNDATTASGQIIRKGRPSFHRVSGETYHDFTVAFCRRFGIEGLRIENITDTRFFGYLIELGCVIIVSVDNLIIKNIVAPGYDLGEFTVAKHAEIIHSSFGSTLIFSDALNQRNGLKWPTLNRSINSETLNDYLRASRRGDTWTSAVVFILKNNSPCYLLIACQRGYDIQ